MFSCLHSNAQPSLEHYFAWFSCPQQRHSNAQPSPEHVFCVVFVPPASNILPKIYIFHYKTHGFLLAFLWKIKNASFFAFGAPFWQPLGRSWGSLGRLWASKMAPKSFAIIETSLFFFNFSCFRGCTFNFLRFGRVWIRFWEGLGRCPTPDSRMLLRVTKKGASCLREYVE